jgi:hypothetical protein
VFEGVYLDCTDEGRKPRFIKGEPPTDADSAAVCSCGAGDVVQTISRRVIRKLRHLGYLEAGRDAVATGMIRSWTTSPSSPTPWPPPSSSLWPLASGPDNRCDVWARALGMQGNAPHARAPAVPVSTSFCCTPPPRCQRSDGTRWNA